jgi:hypothetical protein
MISFSALGAFFYSFLSKCILSECLLDTFEPTFYVEAISKMHLSAHGCVADRLKMLTYYRVCSAFSPNRAF